MNGVTKITSQLDVMMIAFTDADSKTALPRVLSAFAQRDVCVDMICQSAPRKSTIDFSLTTSSEYFETALQVLAQYRAETGKVPFISSGYCKINLFGEDMVTSSGVAARALCALQDADVEVYLITTSDLDISLLIRDACEDIAISALNAAFSL